MTDKQQALRDLLAKVEAGGCHATELPFWKVWVPEEEDGRLAYVAANAYNKSLDAALALHNAVLPGWDFSLGLNYAEVADFPNRCGVYFIADNKNPARAWLIAILKAIIAKGETDA